MMTTPAADRRRPPSPRAAIPVIAAAVLVAIALAMTACSTAPRPPGETAGVAFPSPLAGPGRPPLDRASERRLGAAWSELAGGQLAAARRSLGSANASPHRRLLELQLDLLEGREGTASALADLGLGHPAWAALWLTVAVAAEQQGNEAGALAAARRGAELWRHDRWSQRPLDLYQRWVLARLDEAEKLLAADDASAALAVLDRARALDPVVAGGDLLAARIKISLGQTDEADAILAELGAAPDAVLLRAELAELRGDWATAMELYRSLPVTTARRREGLARAQLQWRLTVLPAYVHQALASTSVRRGELAVILLALAPDVEAFATGAPILMTDIVELPYRREILSAVRADLLTADPVEQRFRPERVATAGEVRDAVEAVCHLLGYTPPVWCAGPIAPGSHERCRWLQAPIAGNDVATIVLSLTEETPE